MGIDGYMNITSTEPVTSSSNQRISAGSTLSESTRPRESATPPCVTFAKRLYLPSLAGSFYEALTAP
jgi:hypothetical protein